ncbi:MAG: hypothetical protein WCF24_12640 [Acidimicrobiales bacterium]
MSAYIVVGYVVALGTLTLYGVTLLARVRAARHRLEAVEMDDSASDGLDGGTGSAAEDQ